ncbi:hypothetical protein IMCC12053_1484 [Celeribacter marinus]|uniref:Uncharacterized protein n=1 Tax=Celeribacter marinus TaxID=1397108 RepID=A0A0P0ABN5_9RHOB|nr:hypothetical protein IMCC12053_1484 [Celeribacter marinus]
MTTGHTSLSLLRTLSAVFRTTLLTVFDTLSIKNTAENVVAYTWKVFYAAATDQNHGVLLKVVAFTGDVRDDLEAIRQAHFCNFTHSRVRLFRGSGVDARTNATLLGTLLQMHGLGTLDFRLTRLADQLLNRWHGLFPFLTHVLPRHMSRR